MSPWLMIIALIITVNLIAMLLFGYDKMRAREGGWRVSEKALLLAAFVAPFGAAYGMRRYHHKTRHSKFLLVYLFMLLQVALAVCLINYLL